MTRKLLASTLIFAVVLTAGCRGNPVKKRVQASVRERLPELIGPADSYDVRAYGSTVRVLKGKLDGLDITGKNIRLDGGLTLAQLDVEIRDLAIDPDTRQIKRVGPSQYVAVIDEETLTRYLRKKYPRIKGLNAVLSDGTISMSALPTVSVVKLDLRGDADLIISEGRTLELKVREIGVGRLNAPRIACEYITSKLGPIFDVRDLGFDATIRAVTINDGALTLTGGLKLMSLVEKDRTAH